MLRQIGVLLLIGQLGCWGFVTSLFSSPISIRSRTSRRGRRCLVRTEVLKAKDPNEGSRSRPKPVAKKSGLRRIDPALAMVPVPLVPDANGNWEALVSDMWLDIENMCKLTELKHPDANLERFRNFCDNYRTQRGTMNTAETNGRIISAQTRLIDIDTDDHSSAPVTFDPTSMKWTLRFAKRVLPIVLDELDAAVDAMRLNNSWSRDVILSTRDEPWDGPPRPRDDEEDISPEAVDTTKDLTASSEESAADSEEKSEASTTTTSTSSEASTTDAASESAPAAYTEETAVPEAPPPPPPLTEVWSQLLLHQASPLATGVLRFPRTMRLLEKYKAARPLPRNVIIGRLPPGKSTEPRSDLHNYVLTVQIPLRGVEGAGIHVGGQDIAYVEGEPIIFDSTYPYSFYNKGSTDMYVLQVDFWHPDVSLDEKQMLAYFWMLWQQDKYHPSTRSKFTRRLNFRKELARKEREERRKKIKRGNDKKDGGGGGSIARK